VETALNPKAKSPSHRFNWMGAVALVGVVLYGLSTGPVWWLHKQGAFSKSTFAFAYRPMGYFIENSPGDVCYRYIDWWSPVIGF
jgi:hypothetical protein